MKLKESTGNYKAEIIETKQGELAVKFPPELCEELGWEVGDTVEMEAREGMLFIKLSDKSS